MERCRLVCETGVATGTKLVMPNGDTIPGVISVGIPTIRANSIIKANVELMVDVNLLASPVFSREALAAIAKHHGYKLVKADATKA